VTKVNGQLPTPALSAAVQVDPLPVTVKLPVGPVRPVPVTLTLTVTGWPTTEGLGELLVIEVVLASFVAGVD